MEKVFGQNRPQEKKTTVWILPHICVLRDGQWDFVCGWKLKIRLNDVNLLQKRSLDFFASLDL